MTTSAFSIEPEPIGSARAGEVLQRYAGELTERFPSGFDSGRAAPPGKTDFDPPQGIFLLVWSGGEPAGCGALRTQSAGIGEIRRMWVAPSLRGRGAGRALLVELERQAWQLGFGAVRLDTATELHEAKALYRSAGYVEVPAYNDNAYAGHWFEKTLG